MDADDLVTVLGLCLLVLFVTDGLSSCTRAAPSIPFIPEVNQ